MIRQTRLYALQNASSNRLGPEIQNSLVLEIRLVIIKVNNGAKILATLLYNFSFS